MTGWSWRPHKNKNKGHREKGRKRRTKKDGSTRLIYFLGWRGMVTKNPWSLAGQISEPKKRQEIWQVHRRKQRSTPTKNSSQLARSTLLTYGTSNLLHISGQLYTFLQALSLWVLLQTQQLQQSLSPPALFVGDPSSLQRCDCSFKLEGVGIVSHYNFFTNTG
jgi:hypothetical protein